MLSDGLGFNIKKIGRLNSGTISQLPNGNKVICVLAVGSLCWARRTKGALKLVSTRDRIFSSGSS
jgi:hypothetical protein